MTKQDDYKRLAAEEAVNEVESGMIVGLGTGSTATFAIVRLAKLMKSGELRDIVGIPSSVPTYDLASSLGIPLATFAEYDHIDLSIDGADEVDPKLNLIKGGGGALLQEKILAQTSRKNIIVVDQSKLSDKLGTIFPLPVEVVPFALHTEKRFLESLGAQVTLRENVISKPFRTDHRNLILDAKFGPIEDPYKLAEMLDKRAGVVEHGLFLGLATEVIVAGNDGIRRLTGK
ncbi:MAG: ribose-5-phosphate isomerase RpiA [Desulfatibacillaceae bacterium]|nr:ribose-5-phosphate isomerase RpiA [Desulfatibacillaceae bacterium]